MDFVLDIVFQLTESFLLLLGSGLLTVVAFYVVDRTQTRHSLRRNFPVLEGGGNHRSLLRSCGAKILGSKTLPSGDG